MATTGETALLGQILSEVKLVAAEVSAVKVTVATAVAEIEHRARQGEDHETRIRATEVAIAAAVTEADLEALEQRRRDEVEAALVAADKKAKEARDEDARKANLRVGVIGLLIAAMNIAVAILR